MIIILTVLGGLAVFLFGMKVMSDGLQKVAGPKMRTILAKMTGNRLTGILTGIGTTCAVQSSSATTVMLVSFVSAGLVTFTESIGVIMGANIGTTLTGWLVALLGFNFKISWLAFPAIILGVIPKIAGLRKLEDLAEVLIGFGIIFLGLEFMKDSVSQLKESEYLLTFIQKASAQDFGQRLIAVAIGALITILVQSSSASMAITITLAAQGLIDVPTACALVMGENIGTTVTANLAAMSGSVEAKKTARAHFVFNAVGSIWVALLFIPFLSLVDVIVPGDFYQTNTTISQAALASHVAMFHTLFNIINTLLFLPFVNQLAWLAQKLVAKKHSLNTKGPQFLDPKLMESPVMALHAVRMELVRMIEEVESMFSKVIKLISAPDEKMGKVAKSISASEETVDELEKEITEYLVAITRVETSDQQSHEIAGYITSIHDIERMGDHCESLHKLLAKRYDKKIEFSQLAQEELKEISTTVENFLKLLEKNIMISSSSIMEEAQKLEDSINLMRKKMRKGHIERLNADVCSVNAGLIFIDMLNSFEKIGDHAYNVAQMLAGER